MTTVTRSKLNAVAKKTNMSQPNPKAEREEYINSLIVEIKVTNKFGQELGDKWHGEYDHLHNEEWSEIVRGLLDEAISEVEF